MELQFVEKGISCARRILCQAKEQEQTQEVRLPDSMPEVSSVLGAWGQVLVRSKSWDSQSIGVCAGVMATVLYQAEDGTDQWTECWIPMEFSWEIPQTQRDGFVLAQGQLRQVDARPISARKLLVRACVNMEAEASVPDQVTVYSPMELQEDISVLKKTYPVTVISQAGEKPFSLEEPLNIPAGSPKPEKILRSLVVPEIQDQKIMAGRMVFRGCANVQLLCRGTDGRVYSQDFSVPFSQYDDLDRDYDGDASVQIWPLVTGMEVEDREEGLTLRAGLAAQYQIMEQCTVEVVEDAYSPHRTVTPSIEQLQLPVLLEQRQETVNAEVSFDCRSLADGVMYPDQPRICSEGDRTQIQLTAQFTGLFYDDEDRLRCENRKWEKSWSIPADEDTKICGTLWPQGKVQRTGGTASGQLMLEQTVTGGKGIPMVTGLSLGEETVPDPQRPSLILRRLGTDTVWDVAKATGSTVEAIEKLNMPDPSPDTLLLIPIS